MKKIKGKQPKQSTVMEYGRILDEAFLFTMTEFENLCKLRI